MSAPALSLNDLSFSYDESNRALSELRAEFRTNAIAVLGPNGAGKSTLLSLLSTSRSGYAGSFTVSGLNCRDKADLRLYRRSLGFMPQRVQMYSGYTCAELLRYVAWMRQVPRADREARIDRALQIVDLGEKRDVAIKRLSGGMHQRLGLAQALVNRPKVVFLDEPTVGLDPQQRFQFRQYLRVLTEESTVVLATHLVEDVAAFAEEVLLIDAGRVRYAGTLQAMCGADAGAEITSRQVEQSYLQLVAVER